MPDPLVECVANYSEARRPKVVEEIAKSILGVAGVQLLDQHSDLDHNRSVLTFVGPPAAVEEAAFRSIAKAAERIDLDRHKGEHPRIGATDVVPFIPISGVTMQDCVEIARRLGRRVGDELKIPVYLYEEAATRPERQNLENIRRGQYEALKAEMGTNPARDPDFGPNKVGPAGATVIGARHPLIAFNVYLTTDDVRIASKIARVIRQSTGGFRYVKAMGVLVEGRAQVSMNLTNYRGTPIAQVVEAVRREAVRYGVGIHHTELVGLIPQEALVDAAVWYLQLDQFTPIQILENKLSQPANLRPSAFPQASLHPSNFLDELAAGTPAPGGGSAAAHTAAAAAALVAMVARLTVGKKKYADVQNHMQEIIEQAEGLRHELTLAEERDAAAYEAVMAAMRLPKEMPEHERFRTDAIQAATLNATQAPLEVVRQAVDVMELALEVVTHGNQNAISDGGVAGGLARAAIDGAALNVRTNLKSLDDVAIKDAIIAQLETSLAEASALEFQICQVLKQRGGLSLK
jgi:glutamate formiminotransferase / formiminotetrahydrofolate cyclodeaminase